LNKKKIDGNNKQFELEKEVEKVIESKLQNEMYDSAKRR